MPSHTHISALINPQHHALEGYSSHFVCLSVADLEDGKLLALQRDTNFKKYDNLSHFNTLMCHFFEIRPCPCDKVKKLCRSSAP